MPYIGAKTNAHEGAINCLKITIIFYLFNQIANSFYYYYYYRWRWIFKNIGILLWFSEIIDIIKITNKFGHNLASNAAENVGNLYLLSSLS